MAYKKNRYDEYGNYISEKDIGVGDWQRIAYENLANAIIEKACDDYIRLETTGFYDTCRKPNTLEIIRFFHSQWYKELTKVDPDYLIRVLDEKIKQKRKRLGREVKSEESESEERELSVQEKIQIFKREKESKEIERIFQRQEEEMELKTSAEKMRGLWKHN